MSSPSLHWMAGLCWDWFCVTVHSGFHIALHYRFLATRCQSRSAVEGEHRLHGLGGGLKNLGHPAAEATLQLMRKRWRQSLITARWPRLLLQQKEGERGNKKPHHHVKGASKQDRLHLHGMLHLFRAFFESASHAPLLMHKRGQKCL